MHLVNANGTRFRVRVDGPAHAPWLVLSHSLGSTLRMWDPQAAYFSQSYRVLRYDARGHGESGVTPGPYTIAQLGHDVLALLDAFDIDRARYCGLSMGGATGLWLAAHAAPRFERFVICNTSPWLGPPEAMRDRAATVRREGLAPLVEATLERWFTPGFRRQSPEVVARIREDFLATPVAGYAACCEALAGYDERASLARVSVPMLVVAGEHDPSPPPAQVRDYAAHIAGAQLLELPAAHLSNLGATVAFNRAVATFLDGRD